MHECRHPCLGSGFCRRDVLGRKRSSHTLKVTLKKPVGLYQFSAHGLFLFAGAWADKGAPAGEISLASPSAWLGAPLLGWIPAWPLRLKLNVLIFPQTGVRCWKWHFAGAVFNTKLQISASSHSDMLQPIWAGATLHISRPATVRATIFPFSCWLQWASFPSPLRSRRQGKWEPSHRCCLSLLGLPEGRGLSGLSGKTGPSEDATLPSADICNEHICDDVGGNASTLGFLQQLRETANALNQETHTEFLNLDSSD